MEKSWTRSAGVAPPKRAAHHFCRTRPPALSDQIPVINTIEDGRQSAKKERENEKERGSKAKEEGFLEPLGALNRRGWRQQRAPAGPSWMCGRAPGLAGVIGHRREQLKEGRVFWEKAVTQCDGAGDYGGRRH